MVKALVGIALALSLAIGCGQSVREEAESIAAQATVLASQEQEIQEDWPYAATDARKQEILDNLQDIADQRKALDQQWADLQERAEAEAEQRILTCLKRNDGLDTINTTLAQYETSIGSYDALDDLINPDNVWDGGGIWDENGRYSYTGKSSGTSTGTSIRHLGSKNGLIVNILLHIVTDDSDSAITVRADKIPLGTLHPPVQNEQGVRIQETRGWIPAYAGMTWVGAGMT